MPKALLTGCNSKFGSVLAIELQKTYDVEIVPRSCISSILDYDLLNYEYDFVFFNHNKPVTNWVFDRFPTDTLKRIQPKCVGWMISGEAKHMGAGTTHKSYLQPYIAQKAIYISQMRFFERHFRTFCYDPGILLKEHYLATARDVISKIDKPGSGEIYTSSVGSGLYLS
jgi:hypothetical protein